MMKTSQKYKEIFKLKRMLEKENIPFEFSEGFGYDYDDLVKKLYPELCEHYQICYPSKGENQWISVIEGFGTYGGEQDRLEIMGGFTPWEKFKYGDSVIGFLTANNVYKRIKKHYIKNLIERGII
ncbi:MAG: hypothetical protein K2P14_03545 [Anaeroplasmataceae bacterium]|nr:hypothetical protein [Anaeroplasmataceae bacterium]